jgi:hypothetical protein
MLSVNKELAHSVSEELLKLNDQFLTRTNLVNDMIVQKCS